MMRAHLLAVLLAAALAGCTASFEQQVQEASAPDTDDDGVPDASDLDDDNDGTPDADDATPVGERARVR